MRFFHIRCFAMAATLVVGIATTACSRGNTQMFHYPIPQNGQINAELSVAKTDTYSIAIEADVTSAPGARQQAWAYLSTPNSSAPLRLTVAIRAEDGTSIFTEEVIDPKLSSWSAKRLYLEVGRVELAPGRYQFSATQTGKDLLQHPSFKANIVVVPAYQGK